MSLGALALRISAARALQGRTFAEDRIFDSAIAPIDLTVASERRPFIVVSCDQERGNVSGRDLLGAEREIDLMIELALASCVPGDEGIDLLIPHTDEGMEVALDLMVRQVQRALIDGEGLWSRVFLAMVPRIRRIEQRRAAGAENGVRYAARQVILVCDAIADPSFGTAPEPGGAWSMFLAALGEDADTAGLTALIETAIIGTSLAPWDVMRAELGLAEDEASGLGIMPLDVDAEVPLPVLDQITIGSVPSDLVVMDDAGSPG